MCNTSNSVAVGLAIQRLATEQHEQLERSTSAPASTTPADGTATQERLVDGISTMSDIPPRREVRTLRDTWLALTETESTLIQQRRRPRGLHPHDFDEFPNFCFKNVNDRESPTEQKKGKSFSEWFIRRTSSGSNGLSVTAPVQITVPTILESSPSITVSVPDFHATTREETEGLNISEIPDSSPSHPMDNNLRFYIAAITDIENTSNCIQRPTDDSQHISAFQMEPTHLATTPIIPESSSEESLNAFEMSDSQLSSVEQNDLDEEAQLETQNNESFQPSHRTVPSGTRNFSQRELESSVFPPSRPTRSIVLGRPHQAARRERRAPNPRVAGQFQTTRQTYHRSLPLDIRNPFEQPETSHRVEPQRPYNSAHPYLYNIFLFLIHVVIIITDISSPPECCVRTPDTEIDDYINSAILNVTLGCGTPQGGVSLLSAIRSCLRRLRNCFLCKEPETLPGGRSRHLTKKEKDALLNEALETAGERLTICCICFMDFRSSDILVVVPCKSRHYFHRSCAQVWLKKHSTCPLCRGNLQEGLDELRRGIHLEPRQKPIVSSSSIHRQDNDLESHTVNNNVAHLRIQEASPVVASEPTAAIADESGSEARNI